MFHHSPFCASGSDTGRDSTNPMHETEAEFRLNQCVASQVSSDILRGSPNCQEEEGAVLQQEVSQEGSPASARLSSSHFSGSHRSR